MRFYQKTSVLGDVHSVFSAFNVDLFKALKPPFVTLEVLEFGGCRTGDKISLKVSGQTWKGRIIRHQIHPEESFFTDIGEEMPWPLKTWEHTHRVCQSAPCPQTLKPQVEIIDDVTYTCHHSTLDWFMYPALMVMFRLRQPVYKKFFSSLKSLACLFLFPSFLSLTVLLSPVSAKTLVIIGDSLTEGYGLETTQAYPAILENFLKQKDPSWKVINGGVSGSTSANALPRVEWFKSKKADWTILALGSNDGLRGIKIPETRKNLGLAIQKLKEQNTKIFLMSLQLPKNYGPEYTKEFAQLFKDLARAQNVILLPFLLKSVALNPKLNLADGIHPNAEGHKVMASEIFEELKKYL
jgi:acyl-CoA thioesterase-1